MKKNILNYALLVLILITSFFSWFSVYRGIIIPEASTWVVPATCFSLYIISIYLFTILVRQEIAVEIAIIFSLLMSLIFTFSIWYLIILFFCAFFILSAARAIRKDLDLNTKVNLWGSLFVGKLRIIFALSLLISSQYFFFINKTDGQKSVPKFDVSSMTSKLVEPVLEFINPDFRKVKEDGLTVDQFILENQNNNEGDFLFDSEAMIDEQIPADLPSEQRELLKQEAMQQINASKSQIYEKNNELILAQGRLQFSQMIGKDVNGNEKIADVFVGFVDKKINDSFQPHINNGASFSLLSYIFAFILWVTILSVGSLIGPIWFIFVIIMFKILLYFGFVEIQTVTVEREMIV